MKMMYFICKNDRRFQAELMTTRNGKIMLGIFLFSNGTFKGIEPSKEILHINRFYF